MKLTVRQLKNIIREAIFESSSGIKAALDAWDDGGTAEVGLRGDRGKPRSRAERIASLQAALDDYGEGFDPTRGHGLY